MSKFRSVLMRTVFQLAPSAESRIAGCEDVLLQHSKHAKVHGGFDMGNGTLARPQKSHATM